MNPLMATKLIKLWPVFGILAVLAFAYFKGHSNGEASAQLACLQDKQKAIAQAIEQTEKASKTNLDIAENFHAAQQAANTDIQIIEKEVIRYVDKHHNDDACTLDADGVRLINDLINIANGDLAKN